MDTYLYDNNVSGEGHLLYYHMARTRDVKSLPVSENDTKAAGGLFLSQDLRIGNITWKILCRPAPKFFKEHKRLQSWSVFVIGLILTFTLLYNLFLILNRAARVEALVKERTIELKKTSAELEKINKRMEFILGATKTGIDIIDSDYNMLYIDPEWQKVYGEYKGRKCYEYFMGAKEKCASCSLEKAFKTKKFVVSEEVLPRENNRSVQVVTMPYQDEKGNWLVAEVNVDITERKKTEEALRDSREEFKAIYEGSNDAIMLLDKKGFFDCNKRTLEIFGFNTKEEFKEIHPSDVSPQLQPDGQDSYASSAEHIQKAYQKGIEHFEWVHRHKNGTDFMADVLLTAFEYHGKTVLQAVVRDITERKEAEEKIQTSEARYRRLFEAAKDGILILDADSGKIKDVNPFLEELIGYSREDLLGKRLWELGIFKDIADSKEAFLRLQAKRYIRYEDLPLQDKNGRKIEVEFVSNVYAVNHKKVIQCNIRDISERKKDEELIANAAREWSLTFDSMADGVSIHGPNYDILNVNDTLCKLLGKTKEELVGKKCYQIFHGKNNPLNGCPLEKSKTTKQKEYAEVFEHTLDKWLAVSVSPILDEAGNITRIVHILRDITERKRIEKAKDEFVSMVSHELRTPLTAINESIKIVLDGSAGSVNEEQKDFLDTAKNNVERLALLINSVLDFQ
ncbi:MAG: PAS domain S-box protein, partial [Candidatus Omnitrophica bacterium]|nr:PAS domain S-box protein [Candidatus Omnitrophota bacterium]